MPPSEPHASPAAPLSPIHPLVAGAVRAERGGDLVSAEVYWSSGVGRADGTPWRKLSERLRRRSARLCSGESLNILRELIRTQIKFSEQDSVLGLLWGLFGPLATTAVMYAIFSTRYAAGVATYPLYLLLGIVLVNFFSGVTRELMTLFRSRQGLLLNTTVAPELLAISGVSMVVYKLLVELLLCLGLGVWYGQLSWPGLALLLPLLTAYLALASGVGLLLAIVLVFSRDAEQIWLMMTRVLFFATPVFYTLDSVSPVVRGLLYWLNPLTPFLISFRDLFMGGGALDWGVFGHAVALGLLVFAVGYTLFLIYERSAVERA